MEIVSDGQQSASVDLKTRVTVITGNVVIAQGTLLIKADRVEVREDVPGRYMANAKGNADKPATFRQKRDGVDEYIEGEAERLEYDGKADTIRFVNNASVRRTRGTGVADEIAGNLCTYDGVTEVFSVSGGAAATPSNPGGRVRAVLTPKPGASAPIVTGGPNANLRSSTTLDGGKK